MTADFGAGIHRYPGCQTTEVASGMPSGASQRHRGQYPPESGNGAKPEDSRER